MLLLTSARWPDQKLGSLQGKGSEDLNWLSGAAFQVPDEAGAEGALAGREAFGAGYSLAMCAYSYVYACIPVNI